MTDDSSVPSVSFLLLTGFEILPKESQAMEEDMEFSAAASDREKELIPLIGSRRYYLHLETQDDPLQQDPRWMTDDLPMATQLKDSVFVPLADVAKGFKDNLRKPLIGRVQKKSRVFHYGKRDDKKDAFPMNFNIIIGQPPPYFSH